MLILEIIVILAAIFIGVLIGGIAIGYLGGIAVAILCFGLGLTPGTVPVDVLLIIMSVIAAIAAMQAAGGLDYLVYIAERIIRTNPKYIMYLGPIVSFFLTMMAGTGHTSYSLMPVIIEVAKEEDIKPSYPLPISVISAQMAITSSPVSAAVIFFSGAMEKQGVSYLQILATMIPPTLAACLLTAFVVSKIGNMKLSDDPLYKERLAQGLATKPVGQQEHRQFLPGAKSSVLIFVLAVIVVVCYASAISPNIGIIKKVVISRDNAIYMIMLLAAGVITMLTKTDPVKISNSTTFKAGMTACICVFGVAWMGDTFVVNHLAQIKGFAGGVLQKAPWILGVVLFFTSALMYSQAATTRALYPSVIAMNVLSPAALLGSFPGVNALFVLPTYPTLIASVQLDDTGSTKIGKYVFNHSFFFPGVLVIFLTVVFSYLFVRVIL